MINYLKNKPNNGKQQQEKLTKQKQKDYVINVHIFKKKVRIVKI